MVVAARTPCHTWRPAPAWATLPGLLGSTKCVRCSEVDHLVEETFDGGGAANLEAQRTARGALAGLGDRVRVEVDAQPASSGCARNIGRRISPLPQPVSKTNESAGTGRAAMAASTAASDSGLANARPASAIREALGIPPRLPDQPLLLLTNPGLGRRCPLDQPASVATAAATCSAARGFATSGVTAIAGRWRGSGHQPLWLPERRSGHHVGSALHAVVDVSDAGFPFEYPGPFEFDALGIDVVEEPAPLAEEHWDDVERRRGHLLISRAGLCCCERRSSRRRDGLAAPAARATDLPPVGLRLALLAPRLKRQRRPLPPAATGSAEAPELLG